jgi:hypothetical protein
MKDTLPALSKPFVLASTAVETVCAQKQTVISQQKEQAVAGGVAAALHRQPLLVGYGIAIAHLMLDKH